MNPLSQNNSLFEASETDPVTDPRFAPSAFEWDEAINDVICPMGKRLAEISIHPTGGNGAVYLYAAKRDSRSQGQWPKRPKVEFHGRQNPA